MVSEDDLRDYLKLVTASLHETRQQMRELEERGREPIAVVAMGCRLPGGVRGPEDLWELVASGTDAMAGFPTDRGWDIEKLYDPDRESQGTSYVGAGGFVYDAGRFDAGFFGINPREALAMDPQQRLLLEVAWEAVERAGIDPRTLRGSRTGVFAGASLSGYGVGLAGRAGEAGEAAGYLLTGLSGSVISGRLSYVLGLEGPAVTVDTACSSALVALHLAAQSLRTGECDLALAGGVMVMADPAVFTEFSKQQGLAADGRCKSFAGAADGTGWAEGAGLILVERLSDARRNGHPILAVVRGSAVNQDGASNGLTAPNGPSQRRVIRAALASARLSPAEVDAVEGHGTGTTLGDPIEAQALLATYGQGRPADQPLWLGSLKSNIGHAQAAAGVAGVIKMVMALQHQELPRTLHVDEPSSHVDWSTGDVRLLTEPVAWPEGERVRRAGVSAFGVGGTNAHVILEQAPAAEDESPAMAQEPSGPVVLPGSNAVPWVVSGRSAAGLRAQALRLREFVASRPELDSRDVAWSLAATRSAFEHRAVVLGADGLSAVVEGDQAAQGTVFGVARTGTRVGFVFAGQGSQRAGMAAGLYAASPVFAEVFDRACGLLEAGLGVPVREVVLEGAEDDVRANQTAFAQAGLFALQAGVLAVLAGAGVRPSVVAGHSVGEVAAAYAAGVLSLGDACALVAVRARVMQALPEGGAMTSIAASESEVLEVLAGRAGVGIAAVNGPAATVVSGEREAVDGVAAVFSERGVRVRSLHVSHAFHSHRMDPVLDELTQVASGLTFNPAAISWVSTATGQVVESCDGAYWAAQARSAVRFGDAVTTMAGLDVDLFVEIGPDATLSALGTNSVPGAEFVSLLRPGHDAAETFVNGLARAWVHGAPVDWAAVIGSANRVDLPTYAFQHQQYWLEASTPAAALEAVSAGLAGSAAEARFWAAVEDGDLATLTGTLSVQEQWPFGDVVPEMAAWRRRERDRMVTDGWRYRVMWSAVAEPEAVQLAGTWLIVAPENAADVTVDEVVGALTGRGARTVVIRSDAAGDRDALAERILGHGSGGVAGVVSLLALNETAVDGVAAGLSDTLALVQALNEIDAPLWIVTRGAMATGAGDGSTNPVQAQAWGLGRVAALEYPGRWGGLIDLPPVLDERAATRLCGVLAGIGENEVAIRGAGIMARRLARAAQSAGAAEPWNARGTALVTGGTGAIAGHVARWLAERGAPRIVLTSRSGPAAASVAQSAAQLSELGAEVDVVAGDVADRGQMSALLDRIGPLSAVMHTAGVVEDGLLDGMDPAKLGRVLTPKAGGAALLDELTSNADLDAFVLFSSTAAVFGGPGQGNYAAANAYLDALAQSRRARGLTGLSVAWGPWAGDGLAQASDAARRRVRRSAMPAMEPALAVKALGQALSGPDALLAVMDVDWARFGAAAKAKRAPLLRDLPDLVETAGRPSVVTSVEEPEGELARQLAALSPADQVRELTDVVRAAAAAVLGHPSADAVEAGRAFNDLGFDSLTSLELRNRLAAASGLKLSATLVFDYPTPILLAQHLRTALVGGATAEIAAAGLAPRPAATDDDLIAIVGMGCRFPGGVHDSRGMWDLLAAGGDAISGFPTDRGWNIDDIYDPDPDLPGKSYVRAGGFIHDVTEFDPGFFGISPREALAMDPQQRLLLEVSWEALEDAGIAPAALHGSQTGVFAGAAFSGYGMSLAGGATEGYLLTGISTSVLSGRVAYTLGLEGPAVTIDTACSSSLVALHLACQALRTGECDLALAGGVSVTVTPAVFVGFSRQRGVSADGRCKSFGDEADGSGWAEGAGILVVERLSDARRRGHRVLAVVRGSALNQDGASNGLTAPNGPSQQRVIRAALRNAGLRADEVDVVEAHGSGTSLGDPIEAQAVIAAYGQGRAEDRPLWLGSVKSNIGHAQAAAGVAGLVKIVMALQNGVLPRTLHSEVATSLVDWSAGNVKLLTEAVEWPTGDRPRRAGVSGFGISGTNAHVILEEAPAADADEVAVESVLPVVSGAAPWVVSGRSDVALRGQAGRLREFVLARPGLDSRDVAWSLASTRSVFEHRAVVTGGLAEGLAAVATGQSADGVVSGVCASDLGRTAFVFPGQGAQWAEMGRELYASSPVFAARLAECAAALAPLVQWSLVDVVSGADGAPSLDAAEVFQPVLWAVMVSLAAVWQAAGVVPDAVLGHSQGEIAAATVAGILSLENAAQVVVARSRALSGLGVSGAMVSVVMPEARVRELMEPFGDRLSIAAVNSPAAVVVSGQPKAVAEFEAKLAKARVLRWRLPVVDYVAHSAGADALEGVLARDLGSIVPSGARIPMYSTVNGAWVQGPELDAGYWFANVRDTVRFADAIEVLAGAGYKAFVEVSPQPVLTSAISETAGETGAELALVTGTVEREDAGAQRLVRAFAQAYVAGLAVDWSAVIGNGQRVDLPTYVFQRQRFWPETRVTATAAVAAGGVEEQFWASVEGGDLEALSESLAIEDARALAELVPALAAWRRRERERSETGGWRYRVSWAPAPEPATAALNGNWLLVTPAELPLAESVSRALTDHGARVLTIPADAGVDRAGLAEQIATAGADVAVTGVVSLLALQENAVAGLPDVPEGLAGTLALIQALGDARVPAPLWVLTSGAVAAGAGEVLASPVQTQVWGLGLAAIPEYPDRWGGMIDLPPTLDERAATRLCGVLAGTGEDQVAIRDAGVMGRRLSRATRPREAGRSWAPRGTVLVTGGSGAIAGHLARWLAEREAPRIVLASRSGASAVDTPALAADLAGRGSDVNVVICDTARRDHLAGLIERIGSHGPALSTVMHTAGVLDDGLLDTMGPESLASVLGAKATGAAHLDELTANLDLDAFVLFSSAAATLGGAGQGNYGAANASLDARAQRRASRGLPALSVAWGPWAVGMARSNEAVRQRLSRGALPPMDPDLALRALGQALDAEDDLLAVMDVDWAQVVAAPGAAQHPFVRDLPEVREYAERQAAVAAPEPELPEGDLARRLLVLPRPEQERVLADLVLADARAVLGHGAGAALDAARPFSDLGFDSLTSLEMRQRLSSTTGLRLTATLLFDFPTPLLLAGHLRTELLGDLAADTGAPTVTIVQAPVDEPIAIVGMSCRYPGGAGSPDRMWELLAEGRDAIGDFPDDRGWPLESLYDPDPDHAGTSYTKYGGFVHDATEFDPAFFGISPREALAMDPQQRLLLEICWEAFEHAGLDPESMRGTRTGVFAGATTSGYGAPLVGSSSEGYLLTGTATSVLSGRVSYTLGLEGPAVTIDTACSSSLVALHQACQALRSGECTMALAGGVSIMVTPAVFVGFSRQRGMSEDGRCKSFGAEADGSGWAEGAGVLVLERLSEARRNGHQVLAVVAGSALNQDGASNGLTAPNGPSQQRVMRAALQNAGVSPDDVDVVEAHGSGTSLGDPIEAQALLATYGVSRTPDQPLWLGSVKSNFGHPQAAAGVAGIIKMVLSMQHGLLPRTLHAEVPSPHVDWSSGTVRILTEAVPWPAGGRPRRAGVSAFGMSGTNAHVIIADPPVEQESAPAAAPVAESPADAEPPVVSGVLPWVVSGRSDVALRGQAGRLREFVLARPGLDGRDLAWSLASTRSVFEHRAVVTGGLAEGLAAVATGQNADGVVSGAVASGGVGRSVFVFPGQGAQWAGMGRELLAVSPVFAARLAQCAAALDPLVDWSLIDVVSGSGNAPGLDAAEVFQPVLWAVMVSLAAVWQAAGVTPDAVVGHSQGEIAAATVAGILTVQDAARVVVTRSRALSGLGVSGAMVSVVMPEARVRELMEPFGHRLSVAAVNSPAAVVVSGEPEAVAEFEAKLAKARAMRWRLPVVDYVAHSAGADTLEEVLVRDLGSIVPSGARIPMYSTVNSAWVRGPELDAGYWFANVRDTVRFADAIGELAGAGHKAFVEVSPQPVLTTAISETAEEAGAELSLVTGTVEREDAGAQRLVRAFSQAFVAGLAIDWAAVAGRGGKVALPTYMFQRRRFWPDVTDPANAGGGLVPAGGVEEQFWASVENNDLTALAESLAVDDADALSALIPALAAWRRRERERSATEAWRYRASWAPLADPGSPVLSGRWLLVAPAGVPLAEPVSRALADRGAEVVTAQVDAGDERAGIAGRITAATSAGAAVTGVVSLVAFDEAPLTGFPLVAAGIAGTQALVQALGDAGVGAPLWVLTSGAVAAGFGDVLTSPVQAQAWGMGRVVALEHPERWGGMIDLPPTLDDRAAARLCGVLAGTGEDQVAVRSGGILARRLVHAPQPRFGGERWTPRGTVLVTGGTGAIAGHVAGWLAERGAPRIVLTSRSGPAARGLAEPVARLAADADVSVVACDIADRDQVAALLGRIRSEGPPLTAVMHTAGIGQGTATADTTVAELSAMVAGKAAGASHLDELTAGDDLDAFVLFSSIAATWGSGLQPGYSAANTYLDALAEARRSRGLPASAVAWGPWDGGGMTDPEAGRQLERRGLRMMDPALLVQALGEVVDSGEGPVTVANVDWDLFAPPFTLRRPSPLIADLPEAKQALAGTGGAEAGAGGPGPGAAALEGQLAGLPEAERERYLVNLVRNEASAVLGHSSAEAVEAGRAFSDLGFDSLTSVELRNRVSAATGLRLPATLLFDYPTPIAVAEFVRTQLSGATAADVPAAPAVALPPTSGDPIVIVAMGCRFPGGVRSPEGLWELVASGTDAVSPIPADRGWDLDSLFDPDPDQPGTMNVRQGSFVDAAGSFDPGFFGISPREALAMDPQQRLLLEVAWEALERGAIDPASLRGSQTGVFVGASPSGYGYGLQGGPAEGYLMTGTATSVMSGRVAYSLGLEGPAVTVDTACSSSLVALHQAAHALRNGECSLALVGGAWVTATPGVFLGFGRQHGLALDGRCKAFGDSADGMGVGEGAGMIVVERLSDARRNGHRILAVVRGSAVNQDGASNGLTAPNGPSQQRVIRAALATSGLTTADVDVVEAHGTGTKLGDPIEAQALLATYGQGRPADQPLWLGSLKSNIGHAQAAAGVAGVIKMVMALQNRQMPRTLHADEPSSHVDWSAGNVRLLTEARPWTANESGRPRRAGVSSFGMSGTNVHTILEEAPAAEDESSVPAAESEPGAPAEPLIAGAVPWVVSGRTDAALCAQAERLREFVDLRTELEVRDVAWSLATTRSEFEHRAVVRGTDDLAAVADGLSVLGVPSGAARTGTRIGFVFAGQGSQRAGMAAGLYAASPVFASAFDRACGLLEAGLEVPVRRVVLEGAEDDARADMTVFAQAGLFALQVGALAVLAGAGIRPSAVAGHSIGEVAAAYAAGVLTLEDACALVVVRGRAMQALAEGGAMTSIAASEADVLEVLAGRAGVGIAAVNGPAATVVSGEREAVDAAAAVFSERGVRVRSLHVSHAFHSHRMDPALDELAAVASGLTFSQAEVPWVSTATGQVVESCDGAYWAAQARSAVRFGDAVTTMAGLDVDLFVEIGPDATLSALGTGSAPDAEFVSLLRPGHDAAETFVNGLSSAWVHGASVDWSAVIGSGRRIDLPTYAFQRQHYWPSVKLTRDLLLGNAIPVPGNGSDSAVDARFWAAVEEGDLQSLADSFAVDGERPFGEVLGDLAAWRRRERDDVRTDGWRYRVSWAPIAEPADAAKPALSGTWLLVTPARAGADLARATARALAGHGAQTRTVEVGPDQTGRTALAQLLSGVGTGSGGVAGVVSLLALDETALAGFPQVPTGAAGTLGLIQALGDARIAAPLWVLSCGAIGAAAGEAPTNPVQAQVWGLGRVAALEHPDRWGGLIDLPPTLDESCATRLCAVLAGIGENEVAVRAVGSSARRLEHADRTRAGSWTPAAGPVLITGGTGAIAEHVARWLAGDGVSRVVLTSRTGPAAENAARLAAELSGLGAEVDVVTADVADRGQMSGLLDRIGPLSTVMHTAGVLDDGVLDGLDSSRLQISLTAKAIGASVLDELTSDTDLDAFVLFSSAAATFGGPGQGNYAAANAYLDALAQSRRARGLAGLSVAWGPWAGDGLAQASDAVRQRVRRGGLPAMDPVLAVKALRQALSGSDALLAVMDVDWSHFAPAPAAFLRDLPEIRQLAPETESGGPAAEDRLEGALARRMAGVPAPMRQQALVDLIRTASAAVLGHESADVIGPDQAFSDLGFDSLTSLELRNHLAVASGLPLPATLVFDYPTPTILADYLKAEAFAEVQDHQPVLEELDRLESVMASTGLEGAGRAEILARLESLARELRGGAQPAPDRDLAAATNDEMFELLELELQDPDFD